MEKAQRVLTMSVFFSDRSPWRHVEGYGSALAAITEGQEELPVLVSEELADKLPNLREKAAWNLVRVLEAGERVKHSEGKRMAIAVRRHGPHAGLSYAIEQCPKPFEQRSRDR